VAKDCVLLAVQFVSLHNNAVSLLHGMWFVFYLPLVCSSPFTEEAAVKSSVLLPPKHRLGYNSRVVTRLGIRYTVKERNPLNKQQCPWQVLHI
jgi:hypothetical protein